MELGTAGLRLKLGNVGLELGTAGLVLWTVGLELGTAGLELGTAGLELGMHYLLEHWLKGRSWEGQGTEQRGRGSKGGCSVIIVVVRGGHDTDLLWGSDLKSSR